MKRVLAILLSLIAIFSLLTVNTYADNMLEFKIVSDQANPQRGDTIEVSIDVTSNPGVRAISIDVSYDGTVLELEDVEYQDLLPKGFGDFGIPKDKKDTVRIAASITKKNDSDITGTFAILKFKVKSDAKFGDSTIQIGRYAEDDCKNAAGENIFYNEPTSGKITVACIHSKATYAEKVDATCTADGKLAHYACPDCNKNFEDAECTKEIDDVVIKALGHDMTKVVAVAATCAKEGNIEYWHCERCEKNFLDEKGAEEATKITTDKVDHTPSDWETDEKDHWKVCTVCGQEIEGSRVAHTESKPAETAPTCTTNKILGSTHCEICNKNMTDGQEVEGTKLGHNMTEVPYKAPTCTEEGNEHYWHCDRCDKNFADNVEYTTNVIDEIVIPALGHNMTTHENAKAATCTEEGNVEYWHCEQCNKNFADNKGNTVIENVVTEKIPHTAGEWMTDADGHWKECTVCHTVVEAKTAHTPGEAESHTNATCTEPERFGAVKCTVCGHVISEGEVGEPALGHTPVHHEFKDSTCTELGNKEYWECTRCNKYFSDAEYTVEISINDTVIQMKEHIYVEHAEDPADHHKSGMAQYYTCETCDKVFDSSKNETTLEALVIAQIPHDTVTEWTTNDTEHWHQCSCGDKFDIAAHEPEIRDEQAPTCTEPGSKGGTYCKVCDKCIAEGGEVIPALGHELTEVAAVDATCTAAGNVHYWHCSRCDKNYSDAEGKTVINDVTIAKLNHNYVNGKCTLCGANDPNYYSAPVYAPVNNEYHAYIGPNGAASYQPHTPSMFGINTDGKYQWKVCAACGTVYDKVLVVDSNPDDVTVTEPGDTVEIVVDDPIESNTTDEEPENTTVDEPTTEPEDTNPKTGIAFSFAVVSAAALAMIVGKKR